MLDLETTIRRFIAEDIMGEKHESLVKIDDHLLENGILDSAAILELLAFLESEFGVEIPDSELLPENFASVESITRLAKRYYSPDRGAE